MLNLKLPTLDDIPEPLRGHYVEDTIDGGYRLAVEGLDDPAELRRAKRAEKDLRLAVEGKNRELSQRVRDLEAAGATVKDDSKLTPREKFMRDAGRRLAGLEGDAYAAEFAKLDAEIDVHLQAEHGAQRAALRAESQKLQNAIRKHSIEQTANAILAEVARHGCAYILRPHVVARLRCEQHGDEWLTLVTDVDGKPMPISIQDFMDELRHTPSMAPLVRGADASESLAHARKFAAVLGEAPPRSH
jgi:hypothetical protein